jgi:hypothetical protein
MEVSLLRLAWRSWLFSHPDDSCAGWGWDRIQGLAFRIRDVYTVARGDRVEGGLTRFRGAGFLFLKKNVLYEYSLVWNAQNVEPEIYPDSL